MVLLLDQVWDFSLEADVLQPVSVPQLHSKLVEGKELQGLDLPLEALPSEFLVRGLLLVGLEGLVLCLLSCHVVAECSEDRVPALLLGIKRHLLQDLQPCEA